MTERYILRGKSELLKPLIVEVLTIRQMLKSLEDTVSAGNIDDNFDPGRRYHPLVRLFFREDSTFKPGTNQPKGQGQNRTKGELRFRLMDETTETISRGNLRTLGEKIKQAFGINDGYVWRKGKELYCYADWSRGYQSQILARSQGQAEELVTKILSLQGHTPIWKYLTKVENTRGAERYPLIAEKKIILGEETTLPLRRPNVEVRFKYADVRISPLTRPIVIYDKTGKKAGALVR